MTNEEIIEDPEKVEWWWIDYLENEMDPGVEKDLELLLEHSQEDRDSFENFRLLKQWLADCDSATDAEIEERLGRMRRNVMAAIEGDEIAPAPRDYLLETKSLRV